jgi:hypothetical protein
MKLKKNNRRIYVLTEWKDHVLAMIPFTETEKKFSANGKCCHIQTINRKNITVDKDKAPIK